MLVFILQLGPTTQQCFLKFFLLTIVGHISTRKCFVYDDDGTKNFGKVQKFTHKFFWRLSPEISFTNCAPERDSSLI